MLKHLPNNKLLAATLFCAFAIAVGLVGHWAQRFVSDPRQDLLQGDYASALGKYQYAAQAGDPFAENTLGNIYYLGLGVERDFEQAARWYLRAAEGGNGLALVNLGILHRHGRGVKKDVMMAFACFRLAEKARIKNAETHRKFLTQMNYITGHVAQAAVERYKDVSSLTKDIKVGTAQDKQL